MSAGPEGRHMNLIEITDISFAYLVTATRPWTV